MKFDKVDRWYRLQVVILIVMIFGVWELFQRGYIFEGDSWFKSNCPVKNEGGWTTEYTDSCSPVHHPSPFTLIIFSGTSGALGLTFLQDAIQKHPTHFKKRIKLWFEEGLVELKAMPLSDLKILIPVAGIMMVVLVGFDVGLSLAHYEECYWEADYAYVNERGAHQYDGDTYCLYANSPTIYEMLGGETGERTGFWPSVYVFLGMPTPVTRGTGWLWSRLMALILLWVIAKTLRDVRVFLDRSMEENK
tara:strand:+ start:2837 stop:3580 length:744 start_codon:yes stop_codon:yes gene_type:complete